MKLRIEITYELAMAAFRDAANEHMKKHKRNHWNIDDWNRGAEIFERLWPKEKQAKTRGLTHDTDEQE